ncbi:MAG: xanthine dehydrogenase family protein subunit M [Candidatus Lambdaproteobacteria bacterium]|nr:xanthine dehydrogenase family protein subunit M [Candidatus Lambdaproteobacteria bacterium]
MHDVTYHAPTSLAEALRLLGNDPAHTRPLAGGTDLHLQMERGGNAWRHVVDLKRIAELAGIARNPDGGYTIGALTLAAEVESHVDLAADYPALAQGAACIGGPPIRNRATLGGNVCNASPAADSSPPLLALGARAVVAGAEGTRELPLADLWRGPRQTTLAPGELLTALRLPPPPVRGGSAFTRLTRSAMDIALVNAAAQVALDAQGHIAQAALALGAVAPVVLLVPQAAEAVRGRAWSAELAAEVARLASAAAQPIDDIRASADYRREMAGVLAARAMAQAVERARAAGGVATAGTSGAAGKSDKAGATGKATARQRPGRRGAP